jgi:hypothetical protein
VQVIDLQRREGRQSHQGGALAENRARAGFQFLVLAIGTIFRPGGLLIAEYLCLRRRHPRPRLSDAGRSFWILASRWLGGWRNSLLNRKRVKVHCALVDSRFNDMLGRHGATSGTGSVGDEFLEDEALSSAAVTATGSCIPASSLLHPSVFQ